MFSWESKVCFTNYVGGYLFRTAITDACDDFISSILNQDPKERITISKMWAHSWLENTKPVPSISPAETVDENENEAIAVMETITGRIFEISISQL